MTVDTVMSAVATAPRTLIYPRAWSSRASTAESIRVSLNGTHAVYSSSGHASPGEGEGLPRLPRGDVPVSIPSAQYYYWSRAWQGDEKEALQEIADGLGVEFEDGAGPVRWLLDDEDV